MDPTVISELDLGKIKNGLEVQIKNDSIFPAIFKDKHYLLLLENQKRQRGLYVVRYHKKKPVRAKCISEWGNNGLAGELFDHYSHQENPARSLNLEQENPSKSLPTKMRKPLKLELLVGSLIIAQMGLMPIEETITFSDISSYFRESLNSQPVQGELILPETKRYNLEDHLIVEPTKHEIEVMSRVKYYMDNLYHRRLVGQEIYQTIQNLGKVDFQEYVSNKHITDRIAHSSMEGMGVLDTVSSTGAVGAWQLEYETALEEGAVINEKEGIDDRTDPIKADRIAAGRLERLWLEYDGREDLAYYAYLMGKGKLRKKIIEAGSSELEDLKRVLSPDTWLYAIEVPARGYLMRNPEETGFISDASVMESIEEGSRSYIVRKGDTLKKIAEREGRSSWHILEKNPQLGDGNLLIPEHEINIPTYKVLF